MKNLDLACLSLFFSDIGWVSELLTCESVSLLNWSTYLTSAYYSSCICLSLLITLINFLSTLLAYISQSKFRQKARSSWLISFILGEDSTNWDFRSFRGLSFSLNINNWWRGIFTYPGWLLVPWVCAAAAILEERWILSTATAAQVCSCVLQASMLSREAETKSSSAEMGEETFNYCGSCGQSMSVSLWGH